MVIFCVPSEIACDLSEAKKIYFVVMILCGVREGERD